MHAKLSCAAAAAELGERLAEYIEIPLYMVEHETHHRDWKDGRPTVRLAELNAAFHEPMPRHGHSSRVLGAGYVGERGAFGLRLVGCR